MPPDSGLNPVSLEKWRKLLPRKPRSGIAETARSPNPPIPKSGNPNHHIAKSQDREIIVFGDVSPRLFDLGYDR